MASWHYSHFYFTGARIFLADRLLLPQVLKAAEEGEGDMEVLDAQFEMANMWAKVGDKVRVFDLRTKE